MTQMLTAIDNFTQLNTSQNFEKKNTLYS